MVSGSLSHLQVLLMVLEKIMVWRVGHNRNEVSQGNQIRLLPFELKAFGGSHMTTQSERQMILH